MTQRNTDRNSGKHKVASTEDLPPGNQHIDKMAPTAALALMLKNQAHAITAVEGGLDSIRIAADAAFQRLSRSDAGRLIYSGAGTSARIGIQDGVELPPTFNWPYHRIGFLIAGGDAALMRAIENAEDDARAGTKAVAQALIGPNDVVIGLAASGKTVFTRSALDAARQAGAVTIGIANNPGTPLLKVAEYPILLDTGGEIIAGSTRLQAGTAQKICLNLLSNMIMVMMGFVVDGMMVKMLPTNEKLRQRRAQIDAILGPC